MQQNELTVDQMKFYHGAYLFRYEEWQQLSGGGELAWISIFLYLRRKRKHNGNFSFRKNAANFAFTFLWEEQILMFAFNETALNTNICSPLISKI